jgi:adenylosuccinate lyase
MKKYDAISPLDFRYYGGNEELFNKLNPYLSEQAFVQYQLNVESAVTKTLAKHKICSNEIAEEVAKACKEVTPEEIYEEDKRVKHYTRALVNCIQKKVSKEAKPFVHFTTTSFDIFDTANAARYKDFTTNILLKDLKELINTLKQIARQEKHTLQVGRTHGQHAVPVTFGFAIALYVDRLANTYQKIKQSNDLRGKIAGAVGAYNAQALVIEDPIQFEKDVLAELNLKPGNIATQVVEPEYLLNLLHHTIEAFGIIANLADDMRHLQRSEISEVAEKFDKDQVGSSTMPHKRNPWNFENIKSMWKTFMPRITTYYMDQICEHQRDLSNSASSRFIPELFAGFIESTTRMNRLMSKIIVDEENMKKNFDQNKEMIIAEPLYILLALNGHPDAHEYVREKTLESQQTKQPLRELIFKDDSIKPYLEKFTEKQKDILANPEKYNGLAAEKTEQICKTWDEL